MTTRNEISVFTKQLLTDALKECEESGDWTDTESNGVITMAEVDVENVIQTVIDDMDLNVRTPELLESITKVITLAAENWITINRARLGKLK